MEIQTIKDLIDLWPFRRTLADEVGVSADRVHKWALSNAIPAAFHAQVIQCGVARGFPIDADLIVRLHAKPLPVDNPVTEGQSA
ncbi:hypothetical protein SAMN04488005_1528 [Yoonia tamlensis]|uniref:Uncharacterized protein n=1 Tax=Yoonia tamlensis TaxID=390270 RepID=A0A1I6GEJ3_9RHOB|nr:hypothetical protein SAMN04488005_1528 [Yoonia tamlensis]